MQAQCRLLAEHQVGTTASRCLMMQGEETGDVFGHLWVEAQEGVGLCN